MSQKEDRLMSIGEIAKSLGITRRIILNYEEKNLLQADVKDGGYRQPLLSGRLPDRRYRTNPRTAKPRLSLDDSRHITTEHY